MTPIRILIVDDSPVARDLLRYVIEKDTDLKVVATAENGEQALEKMKYYKPDVITMDLCMPHPDGYETTRQILETMPLPIVIISAGYSPDNSSQSFKALEAGALAILEKPSSPGSSDFAARSAEIIKTIKMISEVKVIRRNSSIKKIKPAEASKVENNATSMPKTAVEAVAIGASLGGPLAIAAILAEMPPAISVPLFIVQHISSGFTEGFVRWLQGHCALPVSLACDGVQALPGHVYVAPDHCHLEIANQNKIFLDKTPTPGLQPSVSRLFASMARTYGPRCIAVLLTGMGRDGAAELLALRNAGAYTIAQDESSCIMFGMPKAAIELGGAVAVLPLNQIAPMLKRCLVSIHYKGL